MSAQAKLEARVRLVESTLLEACTQIQTLTIQVEALEKAHALQLTWIETANRRFDIIGKNLGLE